jgi:serine/threonine-protein kinase
VAAISTPLADALRERYALERVLGRGGMATVYLARDLKHDRLVALKVLDPEVAAALGTERFQREIRMAARLHHPHVLSVYDSGEAAGALWFAMPYVRGESLRERLRREGILPIDEALRITRQAAQALSYAHKEGVVHRDVKPENLLLTEDGSTQVADFGIARPVGPQGDEQLTEIGMALGTPAYMAPEQSSGDGVVDGRADQYALAATCHEMLTGAPPFTGTSSHDLIVRRFTTPAPKVRTSRPEVSPEIEETLQRALALQPADRFGTISDFGTALCGGQFTTDPTAAAHGAIGRGRSWAIGAVAVLAILAGAGLVYSRPAAPSGALAADIAGMSGPTRLAVLPFENLGDSADAYFADGIADEVRGKLAVVSGLEVIARSSSSRYRGDEKSPEDIAQDLDVQYILTGTVRWEKRPGQASRVRVSPELVDARSGTTRWQRSFDAALTDVFEIQGQIAGEVAEALDLALAAQTRHDLSSRPTASLEAYTHYLHGRDLRAGEVAPDALRGALAAYRRAVEIDPGFAAAWAELAAGHVDAMRLGGMRTDDADEARRAVERAEALAPESPDTRKARGRYLHVVRGDPGSALTEYRAAMRMAPNRSDLLDAASEAEADLAMWSEAVVDLEQAARLDPQSPDVIGDLGVAYMRLRRYGDARTMLERARALRPGSMSLAHNRARLSAMEGDLDGIRQVFRTMEEIAGRRRFVAYVALREDLVWALDDDGRRTLMTLTPADLDGSVADLAIARAQVHWLRGERKLARAWGDSAAAAFTELLAQYGDRLHRNQLIAMHGLGLAYAGRYEEAVAEALRSEAERPTDQNSQTSYVRYAVARTFTLAGRPDEAIDRLEALASEPGLRAAGLFRIDPNFDPIRHHPRFVWR